MIDREKAAEMRRDGMTYKAIGEVFGVSRQRIWQALKTEGNKRKCITDIEKVPYEGLYNWLMADERMGYAGIAKIMFGSSNNARNNLVRNLCRGHNCRIPKRAYDRLLAATGMTYEELFKLRDGYKEEADG